jgi:hypothetical protein
VDIDKARWLKRSLLLGQPTRELTAYAEAISIRRPGVAIGVRRIGTHDFTLTVRSSGESDESRQIVRNAERRAGLAVDFQLIGAISALASLPASPWGPLALGCSIGPKRSGGGTLGALVRLRDGRLALLSNNHVLADEGKYSNGEPILQPAGVDGGTREVALLESAVPLLPTGNQVDVATATLVSGVSTDPRTLAGLGHLAGAVTDPLASGDAVAKVGRTTRLTWGEITSFELDNVEVRYRRGMCVFDGQIEIVGRTGVFSAPGDSGSLVVDEKSLLGVGLLFAGEDPLFTSRPHSYANPIDAVLSAAGATIITT